MEGAGAYTWARRAVLFALTLVLLAVIGPAQAAPPSSSISLVFKGSGTYTIHQSMDGTSGGGCTSVTTDHFTVNWETHYMVAVPNVPGGRVSGTSTGTVVSGPGTFSLNGQATADGAGHCTSDVPITCDGTLPPAADPPTMMYGVGFGQDVFEPRAFGLSGTSQPHCAGISGQTLGEDIAVFNNYVPPEGMAAKVQFADAALRSGPQRVAVSPASSPPGDCSGLLAGQLPSYVKYQCTESLQWSGTVTATSSNPCADSQKACVDPQEKQAAQSAAARYAAAGRRDKEQFTGLGCGPGAANFDGNDVKWACAAVSVLLTYDQQMADQEQAAANDPPDSHFRSVASTRLPHLRLLKGAGTGAIDRLLTDLTKARVLEAAVVTSVNRASGALGAHDLTALHKQNRAALSDARLAVKALRDAVSLIPRAVRELGTVHKRGPNALRSILVSNRSALKRDAAAAASMLSSFAAQHLR